MLFPAILEVRTRSNTMVANSKHEPELMSSGVRSSNSSVAWIQASVMCSLSRLSASFALNFLSLRLYIGLLLLFVKDHVLDYSFGLFFRAAFINEALNSLLESVLRISEVYCHTPPACPIHLQPCEAIPLRLLS